MLYRSSVESLMANYIITGKEDFLKEYKYNRLPGWVRESLRKGEVVKVYSIQQMDGYIIVKGRSEKPAERWIPSGLARKGIEQYWLYATSTEDLKTPLYTVIERKQIKVGSGDWTNTSEFRNEILERTFSLMDFVREYFPRELHKLEEVLPVINDRERELESEVPFEEAAKVLEWVKQGSVGEQGLRREMVFCPNQVKIMLSNGTLSIKVTSTHLRTDIVPVGPVIKAGESKKELLEKMEVPYKPSSAFAYGQTYTSVIRKYRITQEYILGDGSVKTLSWEYIDDPRD